MLHSFAPFSRCGHVCRRAVLGAAGIAMLAAPFVLRAQESPRLLNIGLTPVFLNDDLGLLSALKTYLEAFTARPVKLVLRRTYQEITGLLLSGQLDAAWICGYPYVAFRDRLDLLAVPLWRGKPVYQSYLIAGADSQTASVEDLRGGVHAFSDPNSNSGYLVTAALLMEMGQRPEQFFARVFFTYGHRNVVRAVAAGLADSGSVDGYVWEVITETEPKLTSGTRIIRKSEWLGFPPIAIPRGALARPEAQVLQQAFVSMGDDPRGQFVLQLLRLDGFTRAEPSLFDSIAAKADLVKRLG